MSYFQISNQAPTITDWIQTAVYILTGLGLFLNFWYQRRNLQEQNALRFIEEESDRRAIMPYFEFNQSYSDAKEEYRLEFTVMANPGKFMFINPTNESLNQYNIVESGFKAEQKAYLEMPVQTINKESLRLANGDPIFKIDYMDKEGRPYVQTLHITGYRMYLSDPIEYRYIKLMENLKKKEIPIF